MGKSKVKSLLAVISVALIALPSPSFGQDTSRDFLPDYTLLKPLAGSATDQRYIAPGAKAKVTAYKSIMIDQPVIFLAPDSPYKAMKPSIMTALAEAVRSSLTDALSDSYSIVEEAGPDVLFIGVALTDLNVKKKGFNPLAFTPVGLVVTGVASASASKLNHAVKHLNLKQAKIEIKILDSQSGELLGESIRTRGGKANPESWKQLTADLQALSKSIACELDNAALAEDKRSDCDAGS